MEKIKNLLNNISEKIESNQPASEILPLIRILENELLTNKKQEETEQNGSSIVVNAPNVFVLETPGASARQTENATDVSKPNFETEEAESEDIIEFELNPIKEEVVNTAEDAVVAKEKENLETPGEEKKEEVVVLAPPSNIYAVPAGTTPETDSEPQEQSGEKQTIENTAEAEENSPEKIVEELVVDEEEIEAELGQIKEKAETINKISSHVNPVLAFDFENDLPTFSQQNTSDHFFGAPHADLNETIGKQNEASSINDQLRQGEAELFDSLADNSPIKDLRKAISVNDKFAFINELFRGDEAMYNRSIKTVNNFSIYPEAEFWIRRELKTKLGWDEKSDIVKYFDHMVKRRFN